MDTPRQIRECAKWLQEYWDSGHEIITEEVYTKEPLCNISMDVFLQLGFKHVKQPVRKFYEYPDHGLTPERVEAVVVLCGEKDAADK